MESLYAQQLENHYTELAHHSIHGSDAAKAIRYAQSAAEQAAGRAAYPEATSMLEAALKLLDKLARRRRRGCVPSCHFAVSRTWICDVVSVRKHPQRNASVQSGGCASSGRRSVRETRCCADSSLSATSTSRKAGAACHADLEAERSEMSQELTPRRQQGGRASSDARWTGAWEFWQCLAGNCERRFRTLKLVYAASMGRTGVFRC